MHEELVKAFAALSDENRLQILGKIALGETCGCTLINNVTVTQPTLSYHLNILTKAGITTATKEGVWRKHTLNIETIDKLIDYLLALKENSQCCEKQS